MQTLVAWVKVLSPVVSAVSVALFPYYHSDIWYVAVVAASNALALAAPSVIPIVTRTTGGNQNVTTKAQ